LTLLADVMPLATIATTRPWRSTIGPPELPGLSGIWVWRTGQPCRFV
jgi:hypothetical protein